MTPGNVSAPSGFIARSHLVSKALGVAGLLMSALTVITAGILFSSYRDTVEREATNLHNLASAFAAQTGYATRALELILIGTQQDYLRVERSKQAANDPDFLTYERGSAEHLRGLYLFDTRGQLIAHGTSAGAGPATLAEPIPPAPVDDGSGALRITVSDIDRNTGQGVLNVSRVLRDTAGMKIGTILTRSDSSYFQRIFSSADLGSGGSVTLFNRDGTMLARGPTLPDAIGASFLHTPLFQRYLPAARHGSFETTSPVDGKQRLYGYSSVEGYPLVIITGRDKAGALRVWFRWLWTGCIFLALMAATLLFLAWRVGRESARQAALIGQLATSEARLVHSSAYLKNIIDALATPLWVIDGQRRIQLFNNAFGRLVGGDDGLIGRPEAEALDREGAPTRDQLYQQVLQGRARSSVETELRDGEGQPRTVIHLASTLVSEENTVQIVNTLTDITDRKQAEMRLAYLAEFDPLTELPNQDQFRRVLQEAIPDAGARGDQIAILVVALERLQEVVDLLGHEAGDEVIQQVGAMLRRFLPACRCIARVKNNEFAIMLQMAAGTRPVEDFAAELHGALAGPFSVRQREFYLGPLIGIALFPQDATSVHELQRLADIAKHRAGADGSEPIHFYSERSHILLNERLTIEEQLRRALERKELRVVYQPKVDIESGHVAGFEALLRWTSPSLGEVAPARFIPIAESTGLIVPIGAWVLETACAQAAAWRTMLGAPVKVAVNLSIRQFYQKDLIPMVRGALTGAGLDPSSLELEITESTAMNRAHNVDALLGEIRSLGVELSIDDFGTGYSSLAYLKRFPVQRLKIDRAFVRDLGRDADSAAIIRSIVTLGHGLQMRIVAEGVETGEQLALLRELECDEYQGFLFSRPVEATEVPKLLRANHGKLRLAT
jgi:diguanylate cyclase (GGDEF)-like protein/PAS domain S-box-containing protein